MSQHKQLAQQIQQFGEETSDTKEIKENIMAECDIITSKCDTIIAKIKVKRAKNDWSYGSLANNERYY